MEKIWQTIKTRWPKYDQFLRYWILGAVFIVPLLVFNYGLGAGVIRQLVLFVLVAMGWLIWAGGAILHKRPIVWKKTLSGNALLALLGAVLILSFLGGSPAEVWGLRGGLAESNPWGWLAVLGLGLLITQVARVNGISEFRNFSKSPLTENLIRHGRTELLLKSYLLSSTLLALFVLVWWGINQELIMPALTSFAAAGLFFALNAVIIAALSLPLRGRIKVFWLVVLFIHMLAIFAYDYDAAWYLLGASMLVLNLAQLLLEKRLARTDFMVPFALIILSLVLLFAPARAVSEKLSFDFSSLSSVGANISYPRFFQYAPWGEKFFGAGLGQGTESFWEKAELVDMRQARAWPPLGNSFGALLWDGGLFLWLAWLGVLIYVGLAVKRAAQKATGENLEALLVFAVGLSAALAVLVLLPWDWLFLFIFCLLLATWGLLSAAPKSPVIGASPGQRSFLALGALALLAISAALVFFTSRQMASRLDFYKSIKVGNAQTGTTVDLFLLDRAIQKSASFYGYRLARVDLLLQALQEAKAEKEPEAAAADIAPLLQVLTADYDYLATAPLPGASLWQLGSRAEVIAGLALPEAAADWFNRAGAFYEKAVEVLPRNMIFLVDAARFYRQQKDEKFYNRALELADKALKIDSAYEAAYVEKAEILVLLGKNAEAYELMKTLAATNPNAVYGAAQLAFAGQKYGEAVEYYKQLIAQNANHLQARYELIQAYIALADLKAASAELDELEKRAPADDVAAQNLLKGLRELLKQ